MTDLEPHTTISPEDEATDAPKPQIEWIEMSLVPLPDSTMQETLVYWNPTTEELVGQGAELVMQLVQEAQAAGTVQGVSQDYIEIIQPLSHPTQLAAILTQHFWVLPKPIQAPGLVDNEADSAQPTLQ